MIQVAPNRSQNGLIALAALGVVAIVFVATYRPLPAEPVASAEPTGAAVAASPTRTVPTPGPTGRSTPRPTQGPCLLPPTLPRDAVSAATPKVEGGVGSILFASPVYTTGGPAPVAADHPIVGWEMGLWYVPAPGAVPRLMTSAGAGMVIPLALAPSGQIAAVWWWPERRGRSDVPCEQGIYAVHLPAGGGELLARGDWSITDGDPATWEDPTRNRDQRLRFRLPGVSFSADGSLVAIVGDDVIEIVQTAFPSVKARHVGSCPQWAWAPVSSRFVAGCEDMTSAWLVSTGCCDGGLAGRSIPIPRPPIAEAFPVEWELTTNRAIGITVDGGDDAIRIARTYGFATGCEAGEECNIPPPAWATTTIDWETQKTVQAGRKIDFLFGFEAGTRLSSDASWLYGTEYATDPEAAVTLDLVSGAIRRVGLGGMPAGVDADGLAIYGWLPDGQGEIVIRSVTQGATKDVATIGWPDGAVTQSIEVTVVGLWVAAAA